jgi:hypothetical protein
MISCCVECPAFARKDCFCKREEVLIEQETSSPVDLTLIGFPDWCPLPDAEVVGDNLDVEFRRIARQIFKRIDLDFDEDSIVLISHYLSTVVDIKNFKGTGSKAESKNLSNPAVS